MLNPAAFTHYSYALRDACAMVTIAAHRGAHLQSGRPRGVPPHVGDLRRRHRHDRGLRHRLLPARAARRRVDARRLTRVAIPRGSIPGAPRSAARACWAPPIEADRLVVTSLPNVRYLTGFSGSNGVVVIDADPRATCWEPTAATATRRPSRSPDLPMIIDRDTLPAVLETHPARRLRDRGDGGRRGGHRAGRRFAGQVVASGLVEYLRVVEGRRTSWRSSRGPVPITVAAFDALRGEIRVGASELALARRLEQLFGELGAEDRAFDSIVGSGPNSAIPHHEPGGRALQPGDLRGHRRRCPVRRVPRRHDEDVRGGRGAGRVAGRDPRAGAGGPAGGGARPSGRLPPGATVDAIARAVIEAGGHGEQFAPRPRARRRAGDPRGAEPGRAVDEYPWSRHGDHRRAGDLRPGARGSSHRRHPRRHRRRAEDPHRGILATWSSWADGVPAPDAQEHPAWPPRTI